MQAVLQCTVGDSDGWPIVDRERNLHDCHQSFLRTTGRRALADKLHKEVGSLEKLPARVTQRMFEGDEHVGIAFFGNGGVSSKDVKRIERFTWRRCHMKENAMGRLHERVEVIFKT